MKRYLVLFRGVNVSGKNRLPMNELKLSLENHNYTDVITYINSGNVLVSSNATINDIYREIAKVLQEDFGLSVIFTVVPTSIFVEEMNKVPKWWNNDKNAWHHIIMTCPPTKMAEIKDLLPPAKTDIEQYEMTDGILFWTVKKEGYNKSAWVKMLSGSHYSKITVRNANTALKLKELCDDFDK